jgi:hypothetical protein
MTTSKRKSKRPKMGRPPSPDSARETIQLRVTAARKAAYVRAAGDNLSGWIVGNLDRAAKFEPKN